MVRRDSPAAHTPKCQLVGRRDPPPREARYGETSPKLRDGGPAARKERPAHGGGGDVGPARDTLKRWKGGPAAVAPSALWRALAKAGRSASTKSRSLRSLDF